MSGVRLSVGPRVARIVLLPTKLATSQVPRPRTLKIAGSSHLFTYINAISKDSSKLYLESLCSTAASGHSARFISEVSLHTILLHQLLGHSSEHI